jgi:hypothetical protein
MHEIIIFHSGNCLLTATQSATFSNDAKNNHLKGVIEGKVRSGEKLIIITRKRTLLQFGMSRVTCVRFFGGDDQAVFYGRAAYD